MLNKKPIFAGRLLKKMLSVTLVTVMLLSMVVIGNVFGVTAFAAETFTDGDYTCEVLNDGTAKITKYSGTETDVTVPATLGGKNVSAIGNEAFLDNTVIEKVTISEGIQSIGNFAFKNCTSLEEVNFASTVTSIGNYAFEKCLAMQSIDIPATVKTMGDRVFYNSSILTEVTLHEGLEKMGYRFLSGTAVQSIYIPKSVTSANEAFAEASYLETVVFADGITAIPNDMFEDNTSLRELTIPATVTKLGNDSLCQMGALESIVIPDSVTEWGSYVLYECKKLRSVTIGSGVSNVPYEAFSNCTSLTEVDIPANVTVIGGSAFSGCTRLAKVTLHEGLVELGSSSFANTAISEIDIPASVTKGSIPFDNCSNLKTINISNNATKLITGLFYNTAVESATIPEGITELPRQLFDRCKKLTEVSLPSTLKTIGNSAFENCTALETIDIPASVKTINSRAFALTSSLKTCTFHEGIQSLSNQLFYNSALTSIYIPKTLSSTNNPFEGSNITDVTFSDGITTLTDRLFCRAYKLTEITIPATVTRIGSDCFSLTNIESIVIPDNVKTMGSYPFYDCDNLYAVRFGSGVRTIPYQCFYGCDLLQNVIIPDTVTAMENNAFERSGISYQELPDTILTIPYGTFSGCTNLHEVKCSDNLESVGENAFYGCVNFTTLDSSAKAPGFSNSSFDNCPKFKDPRFYVFNPAHTGIESTGNIGSDHTLVHFTVKYDIRDDWDDSDLSMQKLYLNLPNGIEIVTNSFTAEGFDFDNDAYTGDYKSFALINGKSTGAMRFSAYITNNKDELKSVSAEVEFRHKSTYFKKPVGDVEFTTAKVSLFAPSTVTNKTVIVSGYTATPEKAVKITISHLNDDGTAESTVTHTVTANQYTGKYTSAALSILAEGKTAANEDMFEVYAECNGSKSDTVSFTYMPGAVTVAKAYETVNINKFISPEKTEEFIENNSSNCYDITGIFTRGTSPVVVINPAKMLQFKIQLNNDEDISDVYLMSHKGDDWKFMTLYYDAASDMWIGEGYFDIFDHELVPGQTYVPGALNLIYYYGERKDTYRSHFYGNGSQEPHQTDLAETGDKPQKGEPFYYDKDGKPHGDLGDYHETFGETIKNVFVHIFTGKWKNVPADVTVGGLKAFWQWGNTDDNAFRMLHGGYSFDQYGNLVAPEDRADMLNRNANKDGKQRNAIDPSGIVYEAVEGNPVEDATATIEKFNEETNEWETWNAADFEQENPLLTNSEGAYAWLTDEGKFRVTVSKEGYETQTSEEFVIPPEKLDLNFSLVDKTTHPTATVTKAEQPGTYTLKFSKFMKPETVTTDTVSIDGLADVHIIPVYLSEGDAYADTYTIEGIPGQEEIKFTVTDAAESYSGVSAEATTETIIEPLPEPSILGDVDGDGDVTILDATAIQRQIAKLHPEHYNEFAADTDGDNDISILDATEIQRWLAKLSANPAIGQPIV